MDTPFAVLPPGDDLPMDRPFTVLPDGEEGVRTELNRDKLYSCWLCAVLVPTGAVHVGLPCGHAVHEECLHQFAFTDPNKATASLLCKCQRPFRLSTPIIEERDPNPQDAWFGTLSAPPKTSTSTAEEFEAEREATRQRRLERGFAKTRQKSPPPRSRDIPPHIWEGLKPVHERSEWEKQAPPCGHRHRYVLRTSEV